MSVATIKRELSERVNPKRAEVAPRFFKAGPGEYADGDKFIGVTVPDTRKLAKQHQDLRMDDVLERCTASGMRSTVGVIYLVRQFERGDESAKRNIYKTYLANTRHVNNWDLVDSSASHIVGAFLVDRPERFNVLEKLDYSHVLWERRIAMISTLYFIVKRQRADEALVIADILLNDSHDLIQKAVGWMLREVGKRVDHSLLADYLERQAATMPRTTLRYALEHFSEERRQYYLQKKPTKS